MSLGCKMNKNVHQYKYIKWLTLNDDILYFTHKNKLMKNKEATIYAKIENVIINKTQDIMIYD